MMVAEPQEKLERHSTLQKYSAVQMFFLFPFLWATNGPRYRWWEASLERLEVEVEPVPPQHDQIVQWLV